MHLYNNDNGALVHAYGGLSVGLLTVSGFVSIGIVEKEANPKTYSINDHLIV